MSEGTYDEKALQEIAREGEYWRGREDGYQSGLCVGAAQAWEQARDRIVALFGDCKLADDFNEQANELRKEGAMTNSDNDIDDITAEDQERYSALARERMQQWIDGQWHTQPPMPEQFEELVVPARDVRVGDWMLMPDASTWVCVDAIEAGVGAVWHSKDINDRSLVKTVMCLFPGGFSNKQPHELIPIRRTT